MFGKVIRINKTKSKIKFILVALLCCLFTLLLLLVPAPALEGARNGLSLCGNTVIPSLFPFLVLSGFIIKSGIANRCGRLFGPVTRRIFRLPGSTGTALILGAIGGYPVGANSVAELHKNGLISKQDGERLLGFNINSSPAFIIGAVGAGFLGSTQAGIMLYIAHLGASFIIGICMAIGASKKEQSRMRRGKSSNSGLAEAFVSSVSGSVSSILSIAAYVVLFSSLTTLFDYTGICTFIANIIGKVLPAPAADPFFYNRAIAGVLEVTNGCSASSGSAGIAALILTSVILSWSGLSVLCQVTSMVKDSGLSIRLYVITRLPHMIISGLLTLALFSIFPQAIPADAPIAQVFAFNPTGITTAVHPIPAVCAMLVVCAMLLLSQAQI